MHKIRFSHSCDQHIYVVIGTNSSVLVEPSFLVGSPKFWLAVIAYRALNDRLRSDAVTVLQQNTPSSAFLLAYM